MRVLKELSQLVTDEIHVGLGKLVVEGQGDGSSGHRFADREVAGHIPELFGVKRLKIYKNEIIATADASGRERFEDAVTVVLRVAVGQAHDKNKPTHLHVRRDFL